MYPYDGYPTRITYQRSRCPPTVVNRRDIHGADCSRHYLQYGRGGDGCEELSKTTANG